MRKMIPLLLTVTLLAVLAACAPTPTPLPPTSAPTTAPAATQAATTAPTTAATAAAPTTAATTAATAAAPTTAATSPATPAAAPTVAGTPGPAGALGKPEAAAMKAAGGQKIGGTVSVLGTWGGSEQDSFMAMVKPFEDATGVKVDYTGTRDLNAVLTTRVQGGNPPDLAGLPGPGQMAQFAQQGKLQDLSKILDTATYNSNYAASWVTLGTVDGKLGGVFIKAAAKGFIWYNPQVWTAKNFQIPKTWDELTTLSKQMADSGTTPWCIGLESGAASGWPGSDWLEDIVLRQSGEKVYNDWWAGKITWSSPEIMKAWQTWGQIVGDPKMVYGGPNTMLTSAFGESGNPLFANPPGCYMHHQASFITDFFTTSNPNAKPGTDFDFFPFPPIGTTGGQNLEVAGDLFGMFNDTPQARALIKYLVTPEAQAIWVQRGGAISPNKAVPTSAYPDALSRKSADLLTGAQVTVFDASDLMPEQMNNAFWKAILDFVQSPNNLNGILQQLDAVQKDAYKK